MAGGGLHFERRGEREQPSASPSHMLGLSEWGDPSLGPTSPWQGTASASLDGGSMDASDSSAPPALDYNTRVSFTAPGGMFVLLALVALWRLCVHWPPACAPRTWSSKFFFHALVVMFAVRG